MGRPMRPIAKSPPTGHQQGRPPGAQELTKVHHSRNPASTSKFLTPGGSDAGLLWRCPPVPCCKVLASASKHMGWAYGWQAKFRLPFRS